MTRELRRALRVGGSVVLLAAVVATLPAGSLQSALANVSPSVAALTVGVFIVCHIVAAFKWRMLMGEAAGISFRKALRAHFTGLVGNLTPLGMIGGDVVRAGVALDGAARPEAIVLTGVVDRLVDSVALIVLALAGLLWIGAQSSAARVVLWGSVVVLGAGGAMVLAGHWILNRSRSSRLAGIREAYRMLIKRPGLIARALILSVLVQGSLVAANAYLGASVGVASSFGAWLLAWPAAKFAAYLPVGVAGIGVREAALVALLRPLGGAPGAVMAAGLLWDAVMIVSALGGWLVLCGVPGRRRSPAPGIPMS
jgi:uncharacterized membrane protein YbhN (UPF0104 family)